MKQKKSWAEKWSAQSDTARIANSTAFALAAAGLSYGFLKSLVPLFLLVHSIFDSKYDAFSVTAQLAIGVLMLTQLCVAFLCSSARKKMEHLVCADKEDNAGFFVFVGAIVLLFCLGLACSFMLMDVPAKPKELETVSVFGLFVLNVIVLFIAVAVPVVLLSESFTIPDDPLAVIALFSVGPSLAFLLPGFSSVTFAMWVANLVLTFMLRPVSVSYELLSANQRYRSTEIAVNDGPFLGV